MGALLPSVVNNVWDYGNDFQATLDAATVNKNPVYVPPGTFDIATTLDVDGPVTIRGAGANVSILNVGDLAGVFNVNASKVTISDVCISGAGLAHVLKIRSGDNYTDWRFERCRFEGAALRLYRVGRVDALGNTLSTGSGIASGAVVSECEFTGYRENYTLAIGGQIDCSVRHSLFTDVGTDLSKGDAIKCLDGSLRINIESNIIDGATRDGIDIYDSAFNTIVNNSIRNTGGDGIDAKWKTSDVTQTGHNIIGYNRLFNCGGNGIDSDVDYSTVVGNIVDGAGVTNTGIRASQSSDSPYDPSSQVIVAGNIVSNCTYGMSFPNGSGYTVSSNQLFDNVVGLAAGLGEDNHSFVGNVALGSQVKDFSVFTVGSRWVGNVSSDGTGGDMNMGV